MPKPIKTVYLNSPAFMKADPNNPVRYRYVGTPENDPAPQDKPKPVNSGFNKLQQFLSSQNGPTREVDIKKLFEVEEANEAYAKKIREELKKEYSLDDDNFASKLMDYDDIDSEQERELLDKDMKDPSLSSEQKNLIMQHNTRRRSEQR